MTQKQKDLLIKDLCSRLPYDVKVKILSTETPVTVLSINPNGDTWVMGDTGYPFVIDWENCKPYLFPLSSMTNEQLFEVSEILGKDVVIFSDYLLTINNCRKSFSYQELDTLFNWFDKNHFDYRGLIPMGLAIDATGKNIY